MNSRSDDPALRALRETVLALPRFKTKDGATWPWVNQYAVLAALAAAEAAPLDVERLARALRTAEVGCVGFGGFHDGNSDEMVTHRRDAVHVARVYAALRSPDTEMAERP